jgi:hypothetical protein
MGQRDQVALDKFIPEAVVSFEVAVLRTMTLPFYVQNRAHSCQASLPQR